MRLLIDTHALIWAFDDPARLSARAAAALQDPANELMISAASVWELAIKVGQKKLALAPTYRDWVLKAVGDLGLSILPVTVDYADVQAGLPTHHKDPFDRLVIAQSVREAIAVVSVDSVFDRYGVVRLW